MLPIGQPVAIFLIVLLIMLLGPTVFKRLHIPSVVGMIIAGIIVGPYGFNILERDASFRIFGDVGILYIMFTAAVDIDMFHLRRNYKRGVVFGLLTFLLPMLAGVFGSRWLLGAGWGTSVLIAAMYAAHTLVSYPAVSKFGLQNTRGAVIAVCGTIVAVMLALLCLAGVVQVHLTGYFSVGAMVWLLIKMGVFMAVVGYVFPWATRRFFRNNPDGVSQFIFILLEVFISSLGAQLIGIEAILGAFYAGLILNRMIPARSPLMKNIKFVGDSIFIPYFLIGVGMLINVRVLFDGWGVAYIAVVMTVSALTAKWLAAFMAQRFFRLSGDERRLMFGLSSGKAAATIAAVMLGYKYGMVNEDIMNGAVVMILLCCIMASVMTERAAKRIRMAITESDLNDNELGETEYARQVISVANPVTADGLTRMAVSMRDRRNRLPATALYVRSDADGRVSADGRFALETAVAVGEESDIEIKPMERVDINVVAGIRHVMTERNATEVMIGFHRKANIMDTFFGKMTEQLVEATNRMVIMSRCFIPVDTVTRLMVLVPAKAEYETGFHLWVTRMATLAANVEAKLVFVCYRETTDFLRAVIAEDKVEVEVTYRELDTWDDFILLSGEIEAEDLFVVISARRGSISHGAEIENLSGYLSKHFSRHNLLVLYPRQY